MNQQKRKKKQLKKQRAMRHKLENPESTPKTEVVPKRRSSKTYRLRRKLKKAAPKLIMLVFVFMIGGILWAAVSQNQIALADKPEAVAHEPDAVVETGTQKSNPEAIAHEPAVQQSGQVVIRRSTYQLAGQDIAVRISGDPNPENNGLFYLYKDHLGSVVSVTDEDGNPVGDITRFYPYGTPRSGGTGEVTDRGFTGHQHNDDLGLIYMNSRYYVPGIGRFASPDTIVPDLTNPQSLNRYSYVENMPLNHLDPSGHFLCSFDENGNHNSGAGICRNLITFKPITIDTGNKIINWLGEQVVNIGCGALGGWCVVENGQIRPANDSEFTESQMLGVVGIVNPAGGMLDDAANSIVKVYRVEGNINQRVTVLKNGMVEISGDNMLFLNFGDEQRAMAFFNKRVEQSMDGVSIKSFEVSGEYLDYLRQNAIPEQLSREFPDAPLVVDVSKAADQYGLRPEQIDQLLDAVLPGSGQVIEP